MRLWPHIPGSVRMGVAASQFHRDTGLASRSQMARRPVHQRVVADDHHSSGIGFLLSLAATAQAPHYNFENDIIRRQPAARE